MISIELNGARISGWGGHARYPLPQSHIRKSTLRIDVLWHISTRLQVNTIRALLMIGGIEIYPGPASTTEEEISFMEIDDCSQPDVFPLSSQTVQRTPISSQVVPVYDLDLSSQCFDFPMTPEKSSSTPKFKKRKGYRARKDRNRAAIKKRRFDDSEFFKADNEARLERFNEYCEDLDFLTKHKENQLRDFTKRVKDPDKRAKHNTAVAERLKDPEKQAEHNKAVAERLTDPEKHAEHNKAVAERLEDPEKHAEHNKAVAERLKDPEKRAMNSKAVAERLKDPEKHAEHNKAVAERLKDPEKRAEHNAAVAERLKDPDVHEKHNKHVLEKYRTNRVEVSSVSQSYFSKYLKVQRMFVLVVDVSISGKQL